MIKTLSARFRVKPKNIFLIDSLGAFVTALALFVILRPLNEYIGMPETELTYLTLAALIFCVYSALCFWLLQLNWRPFLLIISMANLIYCLATLTLLIIYFQSITLLGMIYFVGEIIIVCLLVFIELEILKTAK